MFLFFDENAMYKSTVIEFIFSDDYSLNYNERKLK